MRLRDTPSHAEFALPSVDRSVHRQHHRNGGGGVGTACPWRWHDTGQQRRNGRDCPDVLPAGCAVVASGSAGRGAPLAPACPGAGQHLSDLSGHRAYAACTGAEPADGALMGRSADAVPAAFHRAVLDRVHLDRARERRGSPLRGDGIQPVRHPVDAAPRRAAAERAWRILRAGCGRHRGAASPAFRCRPACQALDRDVGPRPQGHRHDWSIGGRSC